MIKIVLDRCQPWRSRNASCRLCLEACPVEGCVSFTENTVSVNNGLCAGCGICTTVCPSGALAIDGLPDEELLSRLKAEAGDKELFLRCSLGPEKGGAPPAYLTARLPCLAVLKESHIVSLIVSGVKKIYLDCSGCTGCAFKSGGKTIEKTVSQARTLLSRLGFEDMVEALDKPSGDGGKGSFFRKKDHVKEITPGPDYSRRELFTFFKEKAVETSDKIMGEKGKKAGNDSALKAPAGRRTLLIESLKSLSSLPAELWINEEEFPVRSLGIRDSCVMCRRCETFCPTGAIERTEDEGETRLDFRTDKCAPCFECAEFCPAGAIYYERAIDLKTLIGGQSVTLMKKKSTECAECGRRFLPEVEKEGCPSCGKKKRLDNRILSILFGDDKGMQENKFGSEEV